MRVIGLCVFEFDHVVFERCEIAMHGLVDQIVAIREEQHALFQSAFPEAPDKLKRHIRFARAGRADDENLPLALEDGLSGLVDNDALIIARRDFAAERRVIGVRVLVHHTLRHSALLHETLPQLVRSWEIRHLQIPVETGNHVTLNQVVPIGRIGEWDR